MPTIWLDVGQLTGLVDGDAAGTLTACGSTTINFTAAGTLRGTYKANQINGRPVIRLDGVDDYYVASAAANIKSFAVVAKYTNATLAADYAGLFTGNGAGNDAYLVGNTTSQTKFYPPPANVTFYKNGTAQAADGNGAAPMAAFAALVCTSTAGRNYTWSIGRDRGNAARSWLGDIAEIVRGLRAHLRIVEIEHEIPFAIKGLTRAARHRDKRLRADTPGGEFIGIILDMQMIVGIVLVTHRPGHSPNRSSPCPAWRKFYLPRTTIQVECARNPACGKHVSPG